MFWHVSSELFLEVWKKRKLITRQIATWGTVVEGLSVSQADSSQKITSAASKSTGFPSSCIKLGVYRVFRFPLVPSDSATQTWVDGWRNYPPCIPMRASPFGADRKRKLRKHQKTSGKQSKIAPISINFLYGIPWRLSVQGMGITWNHTDEYPKDLGFFGSRKTITLHTRRRSVVWVTSEERSWTVDGTNKWVPKKSTV